MICCAECNQLAFSTLNVKISLNYKNPLSFIESKQVFGYQYHLVRKYKMNMSLRIQKNPEFEMISKLTVKLSNDALSDSINDRIDKLETTLETNISHKVANMLDKRINSEVSRMKKDLDSTLHSLKDEVRHNVNILEDKVQQFSQIIPPNHYPASDKQAKIVIRGLA